MTGYKNHIAIGIGISILFVVLNYFIDIFSIDWKTYLIAIPIIILYSILPDVDVRTSKSFGIVMFFLLITILLSVLCRQWWWFATAIFLAITIMFLKHRGTMHKWWMGAILSAPIYFINPVLTIFAFISYLSHTIIGDM